MNKLKGLFLNTWKAQCSIYESGKMAYNALLLSERYSLDYIEINENSREIPTNYDFFIFNYHKITMGWLDTKCVKKLPGLKATIVLEVLPNDPFVMCPKDDFDAYIVLDPTVDVPDKRVYPFPRPLDRVPEIEPRIESEIPVIGTFGFATEGKGFDRVVEAVSKEFERAIVKINIPVGTYAAGNRHEEKLNAARRMGEEAKRKAKAGIEVVVTHDYLDKNDLIRWCARNTLNCFLYNRNMPGLSATTDQAIVSGRPLAVSANETFRHIHKYIKPYPEWSLKDSIEFSLEGIKQMQSDWSQASFANCFDNLLLNFVGKGTYVSKLDGNPSYKLRSRQANGLNLSRLENGIRKRAIRLRHFFLKAANFWSGHYERERKLLKISFSNKNVKKRVVLFVNHSKRQCGIHQYGVNLAESLIKSKKMDFAYSECDSNSELEKACRKIEPDVIIFNYYPATMSWLTSENTRINNAKALGIFHEVTQQEVDNLDAAMFDLHLCPDPTLLENNPYARRIKRLIPPYVPRNPAPQKLIIGSFGFGFADKGFTHLIDVVQAEFDEAVIRIQLPFNDIVDPNGQITLETAAKCRARIRKRGIKLKISHDFLSHDKILDFLAGNTINVFLYDTQKEKGISSVIDYALAVKRPICINRCGMFRHIRDAKPSICIEDNSLKNIISNGIEPLQPFYKEWNESAFIESFEEIIESVMRERECIGN